ncbi:MAG TPA: hypothetical protein VF771_18730 [Longimicrobiaceae bacterium]
MSSRSRRQRENKVDPGDVVFAVFLSLEDFPVSLRPGAMRDVAASFRKVYRNSELPVPEWIDMVVKLADNLEKDLEKAD